MSPSAKESLRDFTTCPTALERITGRPARHFCYPSGRTDPAHLAALKKADVRSATTCEPRLATRTDPLLLLPRVLDSEDVSPIEFEAELSGLGDRLRRIRRMS